MENKYNSLILASGNGSNAVNIVQTVLKEQLAINIVGLVTDMPAAPVIKKMQELGIETFVFDRKKMDKDEFEVRLIQLALDHQIDWLLLAGFMRIIGDQCLKHFYDVSMKQNRVINIHPSLLPEFPGLNAFERFWCSQQQFSGVTLHFVDKGVDTGKIIYQEKLARHEGQTFDEFVTQAHVIEHKLYAQFLRELSRSSQESVLNV